MNEQIFRACASRSACACGAHPEGTRQKFASKLQWKEDRVTIDGLPVFTNQCQFLGSAYMECQVCKGVHKAVQSVIVVNELADDFRTQFKITSNPQAPEPSVPVPSQI